MSDSHGQNDLVQEVIDKESPIDGLIHCGDMEEAFGKDLSFPMYFVKGNCDSMKEIFSAEELHMTKREPEIYEYALNKLNAQPKDTIVFEDSMYAIETARSLGIRCIGIENDWNRRDFMKNHVETIHDFTELHSFL